MKTNIVEVNDNPATDRMIAYAESLIKRSGITVIVDGGRRLRVKTALRSMSYEEVSSLIDRYVKAEQLQKSGKVTFSPVDVKPVVQEI
jgi:hypothetical protein